MTSEHFDQLLVSLMGRTKFRPFIVELAGSHQFIVGDIANGFA
jgi:hypothetical protein